MAFTGLTPVYALTYEQTGSANRKAEEVLPELVDGSYYLYTVLDDNTVRIDGANKEELLHQINEVRGGTLEIPSILNGREVTEIGEKALTGYYYEQDIDENGSISANERFGVTSIIIPDTVVRIGNEAFADNRLLESISFGSVREIGDGILNNCDSITTLTLPGSLESLAGYFGALKKLTEINIEANDRFKSVDGVLFSADGKELVSYPAKHAGDTYIIPDGVETIRTNAFADTVNLKKIVVPASVKKLCDSVFSFAYSVEGVYFLGAMPSMPESTDEFSYIVDGVNLTAKMKVYALNGDESWNSRVDGGYFNDNGVKVAFERFDWSDLDTIFERGFTYSVIDEAAKTAAVTGYNGFGGAVTIPASVNIDGSDYTVTDVKFDGENPASFDRNTNITTLTLPSTLENISDTWIISGIPALQNIYIDAENGSFKSVDGVLYSKSGDKLVLYPAGRSADSYNVEDDCVVIGNHAFFRANSIRFVFVPQSVTFFEERAIFQCDSYRGVFYKGETPEISEIDGVYYAQLGDEKILSHYPESKEDITYTVEDGTTAIGLYAFASNIYLTSVKLPSSITSIKNGAFYNVKYGGNVSLPSVIFNSAPPDIQENAFYH